MQGISPCVATYAQAVPRDNDRSAKLNNHELKDVERVYSADLGHVNTPSISGRGDDRGGGHWQLRSLTCGGGLQVRCPARDITCGRRVRAELQGAGPSQPEPQPRSPQPGGGTTRHAMTPLPQPGPQRRGGAGAAPAKMRCPR